MTRSVSLDAYMVKRPIKVKASATVIEAVDVILENRVSGVCVVDDNDNLVGMLSELDCLRAIIERVHQNRQPTAGYVYEVMTKDVVVNKPGDDIVSVANSMLDEGHRRRPIMDSDKLVGQVTCRQLLSAIKSFS